VDGRAVRGGCRVEQSRQGGVLMLVNPVKQPRLQAQTQSIELRIDRGAGGRKRGGGGGSAERGQGRRSWGERSVARDILVGG